MNPLFLWEWRPYVLAPLAIYAVVYSVGWVRLRRRSRALATRKRLLAMAGGIACMLVALISPIDFLADEYFSIHMIQHFFLWFPGPILLLLARPLPFWSWGLKPLRPLLKVLLSSNGVLLRTIKVLTRPSVALLVSTAVLWVWHAPSLYNLALLNHYVHDSEHISFAGAFLLYWWPLIGSPPQPVRLRSNVSKFLYIYLGAMQGMLLSILILSSNQVLYTYYLGLPGRTVASVLANQQLGGALMLIPGMLVYLLMAVYTMNEE